MHEEEGVTWALAWSPEDGTIDVDSEGRYQDRLSEWLNDYGSSTFYYNENGNSSYTVTDGTNSETLQFNEAQTDVVPMPADFSPGPQTMYYRTVTLDGTTRTLMCSADGKLLRFNSSAAIEFSFDVQINGQQIALNEDTSLDYNAWGAAMGGVADGWCIWSNDGSDAFVLTYDGGKLSVNIDYIVSSGELTQWNG